MHIQPETACGIRGSYSAVSEILGTVILIGIVVAAVSIVGVVLWSQPPPQKIPALSAIISNRSCSIYMYHEGGDMLERESFQILVDGTNQTANFTKRGVTGSWASWVNGDTLEYAPPVCSRTPERADIVYNDGTSMVIIASAFFGSYSPTGMLPNITPPSLPVANFEANLLTGTVPLTVQFTDTSTGPPTTWNWIFGDFGADNTSTLQNPSHMYTTAGSYSVNLTVTNASGSNTLIKTNYITVNMPAPVANFTGTPTTGPAPLSVSFTDSSTGSPTSWNWIFGDTGAGNTSTLQNPSHTYTNAGTYSVNLTVSNAGGSNSTLKTDYILVPVSGCFSDNFNDNSIGPAWVFIGGTWSESGGVLAQTSSANGDPRKAIISNAGLINNQNYVITAKVRIDSWVNGDYARGGVSLFSNTGDGNGYNLVFHNDHNTVQWLDDRVAWGPSYTFSWSTGTWYWFKMKSESGTLYGKVWQDGSPEPATWPYTWARSGRTGYPALNGGSSDGVSSATVSFDDVTACTLPLPPIADFTGSPTSGSPPLTVSFMDTSTGSPTSWIWTFGDIGAGNTSTLQNPVHNYTTNGNYNVTLLATNGFGSNVVRKDNYIIVNSSIVCFNDNFNDNSIGPAWVFIGGTWSESGGVLAQTSSANGDPRKAIISNAGLINNQNYVITAKVRIDSWVNGDYARGGVSLFSNTGDGNGYNLVFHNDHNTVQWLDDRVAWGPSYTFSWSTGTWYWFKMKSESGTLYGKVWQDGSPEPATWPYTWARSGRTGYPALNGGSSDGVSSATVSFDDVTVCPN
jgi:PKD repeat protein